MQGHLYGLSLSRHFGSFLDILCFVCNFYRLACLDLFLFFPVFFPRNFYFCYCTFPPFSLCPNRETVCLGEGVFVIFALD